MRSPRKKSPAVSVHVSVPDQTITLRRGRQKKTYPISTSKFGLGSEEGSMKTPTGRLRVSDKIGAGEPIGTVFKSRKPVGHVDENPPGDDLVLSRILWLEGMEASNANTRARYIYIHGTNHEAKIGEPASHGCIRMRNADLIKFFELVDVGTEVVIEA